VIDLQAETLIPLIAARTIVPVSEATIRRWAASGKLETVRAGRKIFTTAQALARMMQQGTPPSPAARQKRKKGI
jgi:hypothetical protein